MSARPLAIRRTGLVTAVGLSAPAACAAMRTKLTNPSETRFIDSRGAWIVAHQVALEHPCRGLTKLAKMAAMAIKEVLAELPRAGWSTIPLLLCVAEHERPGRMDGLDDRLLVQIEDELRASFAPSSAVLAHGRIGAAMALSHARTLLQRPNVARVLIVATDSLISWPTLSHYDHCERLLTPRTSDGFMPGEGAGALLVGQMDQEAAAGELVCTGIGFGMEKAHIDSNEPLRAQGLEAAVKAALNDAGVQMHDIDYRITDLSGEQYYFKEAALALSRTLRRLKQEFDLWHPAECIGETGALAGVSVIALADAASRKGYAAGPAVLAHMANDAGQRAALTLQRRGD